MLCVESVFAFSPLAFADDAATLHEVTVSAHSDAQAERREAVTQKTVIERAEIEALGGLTVGETIRKLPGIDAGQHTGDGAPAANARGMGRDSVQFLVDGERPSANARYALTGVGRLPSGELERIEILRGASAEHGGATPLTVNLVMRKAQPSSSTTLKATVGARGGAANGQFSVSQGGGSGDRNNGFSWLLPLTINEHRMPLEKSLVRQNADAGVRTLWQEERERSPYALSELIVSPRLTWKRSGDSLSLWPSYYRNEGRRDGAMTRSAYADPAAGSGLAADGGRREREDSRLS
ncbi:MAG: TonB-dependent receptor plug domain-containing protein, partial [Rhodocyclaceae bacterium]